VANERLTLELNVKTVGQAEVEALTTALNRAVAAGQGSTDSVTRGAQAVRNYGDAFGHSVPQVAAASGAIREFEGTLPIRAVERFLTTTLSLGPALQAAFPLVGGIAFAGMLVKVGEEVYKLYKSWDPLTKAQELATESAKQYGQQIRQIAEQIERIDLSNLRLALGPIAAGAIEGAGKTSFNAAVSASMIELLRSDIAKESAIASAHKISIPGVPQLAIDRLIESPEHAQATLKVLNTKLSEQLEVNQLAQGQQQQLISLPLQASKDEKERKNQQAAEEQARKEKQLADSAQRIMTSSTERSLTNPLVRSLFAAGTQSAQFVGTPYLQGAQESGQRDVNAAYNEEARKALAATDKEYAEERNADAKQFLENLRLQTSELERQLGIDHKLIESEDSLTKQRATAQVRQIESTVLSRRKQGSSEDPAVQKQLELDMAQKIFDVEMKSASQLMDADKRREAFGAAQLKFSQDYQKAQETAEASIADIEQKRLETYRETVGSLFDAATSRNPMAMRDLLRSTILGQGRTIVENATSLIWPQIEKVIPHATGTLGTLLKGTPFGPDPLKSSTDLNTTATTANTAAMDRLTGALSGRGTAAGASISSGTNGIPGAGAISGGSASDLGGVSGGLVDTSGYDPNFMGPQQATQGLMMPLSLAKSAGSSTLGKDIGIAASVAAGSIAAYKDFSKGGVGGALGGAGAIAGVAAAVLPAISSTLALAGPIGAIAGIGLSLLGGLFNGPQQRANAINKELSQAQYIAPQALNVTQSSSGGFTDFDARGNIRTSNFSAIPTVRQGSIWEQTHGLFGGPPTFYDVPGGQTSQFGPVRAAAAAPALPPATIIIQAMDMKSFSEFAQRNNMAIGNAAASALQNAHARLTSEVQRAANG
jgi:hypothetical protein